MKTKQQIVAELLQQENVKQVKNLTVKNVTNGSNSKNGVEHDRLGLTLDREIDAIEVDENTNNIVETTTNVIFTTPISIGAILKDNIDIGFAVSGWNKRPEAYQFVLAGAKIDVLQERVPANTPYKNPFSTNEDGEQILWDVDKIINHVISCEVLPRVKDKVDKLADSMLGI